MRRRNAQQRTEDLDGLYRELYPSLVRFSQGIVGSRSDAEDAVHDAFVAAVRTAPADDPRPWLFRVTRNASIDLLRRRKPTVPIEAVEAGLPATGSIGPHASAVLSEQLALMRTGLDALPERGRTALLLRELAGLPYSEIGQVLDTTEGNVKVLIFRARASLHELAEATELDCGRCVRRSPPPPTARPGAPRARANLHSFIAAPAAPSGLDRRAAGRDRRACAVVRRASRARHDGRRRRLRRRHHRHEGRTHRDASGGHGRRQRRRRGGLESIARPPCPPSHIAAAAGVPSVTAHGEGRAREQAWGEATDTSGPTDTGAGTEPGDGNGNSSDSGGGDNEAETSAGTGTQFASLTAPAPGAGAPATGTTTSDDTAWHQRAASEPSDGTSQPAATASRDS